MPMSAAISSRVSPSTRRRRTVRYLSDSVFTAILTAVAMSSVSTRSNPWLERGSLMYSERAAGRLPWLSGRSSDRARRLTASAMTYLRCKLLGLFWSRGWRIVAFSQFAGPSRKRRTR
jgi:hypothetical protein